VDGGAQSQQNQVLAALKNHAADLPNLVLLEGEAGVGKSHTLESLAQKLKNPVLVGARDWLPQVLTKAQAWLVNERDAGFLEAARKIAPNVNWARVALDPVLSDRDGLWNVLAHAFERLAKRLGGLHILLEDAHEMSEDDLGALRALYRRSLLGQTPIFLVLSLRPSELDLLEGFKQDAALAGKPSPQKFVLRRLEVAGVNDLICQQLHTKHVPGKLVTWLLERSEGHALYTVELLRHVRESGALRNLGMTWVFEPPKGKGIPKTLEAMLVSRVLNAKNYAQTWRALSVLSVLERVSLKDWATLLKRSFDSMLEITARLEYLGLIREGAQTENVFSLAHPLYAPLVRAQLSETELQSLHLLVLQIDLSLTERAKHARLGTHPKALELIRASLNAALERFQFSQVLLEIDAAFEFELNPAEQLRLLELKSRALVAQTKFAEVLEVPVLFESPDLVDYHAYALARLAKDNEGFEFTNTFINQFENIRYYWTCFPMRLGMKELARERLAQFYLPEFKTSLALWSESWYVRIFEPHRLGRQIELYRSIVEAREGDTRYDIADHKDVLLSLLDYYALLHDFESAEGMLDQLLQIVDQTSDLDTLSNRLCIEGHYYFLRGRYADAHKTLMNAVAAANLSNDPVHQSYAHFYLFKLEYARGNLELARQQLEAFEIVNVAMNNISYDAPRNLEIAWRVKNFKKQNLETEIHGLEIFNAARISLLEHQPAPALEILESWRAETWLDLNGRRVQNELPERAFLRGLSFVMLEQFESAASSFELAGHQATALDHQPLMAEIQLAQALLYFALRDHDRANTLFLSANQRLQATDANGHSLFLKRLFPDLWRHLETEKIPEAQTPRKTGSFLRTFGTFSLERDGVFTPWRASKARALLALLLIASLSETDPRVSKTTLIDALWTEDDDIERSDNKLRVTVKRLREQLGDAAIILAQGGSYQLSDINADVNEFVRALERLDFDAALGWYKGAFLPEIDLEGAEMIRAQLWQRFRDTALRVSYEQPGVVTANLLEKLHAIEPFDLPILERLLRVLNEINDPLRLERTRQTATSAFERELGEIPAELVLLRV
jgi:DNA-binding SARP family transcriptional activator